MPRSSRPEGQGALFTEVPASRRRRASASRKAVIPVSSGPVYVESWDEYFLAIADAVARKSKDPRCQVGAIVVRDKLILTTGFNGFARGVYDDDALLQDVEEKLKLVCHAEFNAVLNSARVGVSLAGGTMYITKFPCLSCCNAMVQAGVKRLYTHDARFWDDDPADPEHRHKVRVLKQGGIEVVAPYHPEYNVALRDPELQPRKPPKRAAGTSRPRAIAAVKRRSAGR